MDSVSTERNAAIELYRLFLMFGICLLHACIRPGYCRAWFVNCTPFCVTAFAFVSGYFGVRFKVSKILRLEGLALVCAFICAKGNPVKAWQIFGAYWFLHAYVFMMCLTPVVDKAFDLSDFGLTAISLPLLAVVYVWGFAPTLPIVGGWHIPVTPGLEAYSGITLLAAYVSARIYRKYEIGSRLRTGWTWAALPVLFILSAEYHSVVALLLAATTFHLFSRLRLSGRISRCVLFLSPSVFAIYLLHQPNIGMETDLVKRMVDGGCPIYLAYFSCAGAAFALALLADMPRRLLAAAFRRPLEFGLKFADRIYCEAVSWIDRVLRGRGA